MVEEVDGSCGSAVKPARDELQGDGGLLQLFTHAAQAHICRSCICLHAAVQAPQTCTFG